ncbi:MAG: ammonia-forming cytochrome c nitrite reductase subunit c552 [Bacillota bacterium]
MACADCHMPYRREGNVKVTSHWWSSPLRHLEGTCTVCHTEDVELLKQRVFYTQDRVKDLLDRAGQALAGAIDAIANARQTPGVDAELIRRAQDLHREAQWYWDWCSAENSTGFHNPQTIMATLGKAIDLAHQARAAALAAVAAQAR